jgi:hypothetical protein
MDSAKLLRRTICRLAKDVDKHQERISVNAMLDLSAQIKRSNSGKLFASFVCSYCGYDNKKYVFLL